MNISEIPDPIDEPYTEGDKFFLKIAPDMLKESLKESGDYAGKIITLSTALIAAYIALLQLVAGAEYPSLDNPYVAFIVFTIPPSLILTSLIGAIYLAKPMLVRGSLNSPTSLRAMYLEIVESKNKTGNVTCAFLAIGIFSMILVLVGLIVWA